MDVVDLTMDLCRIPSLTGNEAAVMAHALTLCERMGLRVRTQTVATEGRVNVLAEDPTVPAELLFSTHLDTVPPYIPPVDTGEKLTGRGTCDAKGPAAAMFCALERLRNRGEKRAGLLFLVGEETTSDGAKAAAKGFAPTVRWLINGEPTSMALASGQKGILAFRLTTKGVACHSAYPELGHSAIHALLPTLNRIITESWPRTDEMGETTVNIGLMQGGVAQNVLAPEAEARGVFRLVTPLADMEARVRAMLPSDVEFERTGGCDPITLHTLPGFRTEVVRFGSDVPYLRVLGTPLMLGPGSIHDAHTAHEFVLKADLYGAVEKYESIAVELLG
ncbi:MAG: M20/M25/M40 family metallo-hydrolase [Myxococcota bacterium]